MLVHANLQKLFQNLEIWFLLCWGLVWNTQIQIGSLENSFLIENVKFDESEGIFLFLPRLEKNTQIQIGLLNKCLFDKTNINS